MSSWLGHIRAATAFLYLKFILISRSEDWVCVYLSFTIYVYLHNAEHITDIAVMMYQYLKLVLESGIQEWIFEEARNFLPIILFFF